MRGTRWAATVTTGMLLCALPAAPAHAATSARAAAAVPAADLQQLPALRALATAATAEAEDLSAALLASAARSASLRVAMDRVAESQDAARAALDRRLREAYMASSPDPLRSLAAALAPDSTRLLARGAAGGVTVDRRLLDAVETESADVRELRRQAEAVRADLVSRADAVYAAQDRARELLRVAEEAAADAERRAADERERSAAAAARRETVEQQAALARSSEEVSFAVAPAVTTRGRRAAAAQEPVVALLEKTQREDPGAVPVGFRPTGQVLIGESSWYGPGFVGKPTASGSPYDPERLTAAMTSVPLGTVVRVSRPDGRAVCVLITDRGPYVGDRILDLSQAAMRELGRFGVGDVRIDVLEPS